MASHSSDVSLKWGPTNIDRFLGDPKRIAFFMSRYKFAAKMLSRCSAILDVGCGDGMGTATFLSDTKAQEILGIDWEKKAIDYAERELRPALHAYRPEDSHRLYFQRGDFFKSKFRNFDGLCCLDVIEHIEPGMSSDFVARLAETMNRGAAIVGTPNVAAAKYGSVHSQIGHINLMDADQLRFEMEQEFRNVFMFSMNDEIVHTGFDKMAHYLIAVGVK